MLKGDILNVSDNFHQEICFLSIFLNYWKDLTLNKFEDIFLYAVAFPSVWNLDWLLLPECSSQGFTQHQIKCCSDPKLARSTIMEVMEFFWDNFASIQKNLSESHLLFWCLVVAGSKSVAFCSFSVRSSKSYNDSYPKEYSTLPDLLCWLETEVVTLKLLMSVTCILNLFTQIGQEC